MMAIKNFVCRRLIPTHADTDIKLWDTRRYETP